MELRVIKHTGTHVNGTWWESTPVSGFLVAFTHVILMLRALICGPEIQYKWRRAKFEKAFHGGS